MAGRGAFRPRFAAARALWLVPKCSGSHGALRSQAGNRLSTIALMIYQRGIVAMGSPRCGTAGCNQELNSKCGMTVRPCDAPRAPSRARS
jgi:hypothetical protein